MEGRAGCSRCACAGEDVAAAAQRRRSTQSPAATECPPFCHRDRAGACPRARGVIDEQRPGADRGPALINIDTGQCYGIGAGLGEIAGAGDRAGDGVITGRTGRDDVAVIRHRIGNGFAAVQILTSVALVLTVTGPVPTVAPGMAPLPTANVPEVIVVPPL